MLMEVCFSLHVLLISCIDDFLFSIKIDILSTIYLKSKKCCLREATIVNLIANELKVKLLEELKIILYILGLFFAVLLLKGLSMFEYNLRDKATTYKDVYVEEFDTKQLRNFFKRSKEKNITQEEGRLLMTLGGEYTTEGEIPLDEIEYGPSDTGYIEIKINPGGIASLVWRDVHHEIHSIAELSSNTRNYIVVKSDLLALSDFSRLEIISYKALGNKTSDATQVPISEYKVEYVKFVQRIIQEELF